MNLITFLGLSFRLIDLIATKDFQITNAVKNKKCYNWREKC